MIKLTIRQHIDSLTIFAYILFMGIVVLKAMSLSCIDVTNKIWMAFAWCALSFWLYKNLPIAKEEK